MNLTDLFIIYFAGGAPFAVYHFLQNRHDDKTVSFWLKNFLVLLLWLPFAAFLLLKNRRLLEFDFLRSVFDKNADGEKVYFHRKQIESVLLESDLDVSIFDFRETFERFVGLTLAVQADADSAAERETFRAAKNGNVKLGAICLHRRNRKKLVHHQTEARRDFLQIVEQLSDSISDTETLCQSAVETVKILKDDEGRELLEKMFAENLQTGNQLNVKYTEKDLWKPQERKPLRTETILTRL